VGLDAGVDLRDLASAGRAVVHAARDILLRQREIDWFYKDGCNWLFPDAFAAFEAVIPPDERDDLIGAYYKRLTSSDVAVQLAAARAWSVWEGATLSVQANEQRLKAFSATQYARAFARIECHYFVNGGFFERETTSSPISIVFGLFRRRSSTAGSM
jgi:proline iminopeptidase